MRHLTIHDDFSICLARTNKHHLLSRWLYGFRLISLSSAVLMVILCTFIFSHYLLDHNMNEKKTRHEMFWRHFISVHPFTYIQLSTRLQQAIPSYFLPSVL